jgi:hypothetical protein
MPVNAFETWGPPGKLVMLGGSSLSIEFEPKLAIQNGVIVGPGPDLTIILNGQGLTIALSSAQARTLAEALLDFSGAATLSEAAE